MIMAQQQNTTTASTADVKDGVAVVDNGVTTTTAPSKKDIPPSATAPRKLEPLEVGWQFVQEYYTILNKDPNRLHCFYNKKSAMIHGSEGETVKTCLGQQDIHKRFKDLDLQDSKVVISNVDSLGTLSNGIIVSVIGEMESRGKTSRKFTQSFVLAEQPNGFFVLNDVFRYLKDGYEEEEVVEAVQEPARVDTPVVEPRSTAAASTGPLDDMNGMRQEIVAAVQEPLPVVDTRETQKKLDAPSVVQPSEAAIQPVDTTTASVELSSTNVTPASSVTSPQKQKKETEKVVSPTQTSSVNSAPKTWAKLASADKERWASHASDAKGQTVSPAATSPAPSRSRPSSAKGGSNQADRDQSSQQQQQPKSRQQQHELSDIVVFIRGFSKSTKLNQIKETFSQVVGNVKWVDLITESSAFVEFSDMEQVKKAISLKSVSVNGETVVIEDKRMAPQPNRKGRKASAKSVGTSNGSSGNLSASSGAYGKSNGGGFKDGKSGSNSNISGKK